MRSPRKTGIERIKQELEHLLEELPSVEERQRIEVTLGKAIATLKEIQDRLRLLPSDEETNQLRQSLETIASFLSRAKVNPRLSLALGLHSAPKSTKSSRSRVGGVSLSANKILAELEPLTTEQIEHTLLDEKQYSVRTLREIARALDIKIEKGAERGGIVDKIVKIGFANRRGYAILGPSRSQAP